MNTTTDTDINVLQIYDENYVIWKYELPMMERFDLRLPKDSKILCIQTQTRFDIELMNFWILVNNLIPIPIETRHFLVLGTGQRVPMETLRYLGTTQLAEGRLVFHVFEILPPTG